MQKFDWTTFKKETFSVLMNEEAKLATNGVVGECYHVIESLTGGRGLSLLQSGFPSLEAAAAYVEGCGEVYFADRDRRCIDVVVAQPRADGRILVISPFLPPHLAKEA